MIATSKYKMLRLWCWDTTYHALMWNEIYILHRIHIDKLAYVEVAMKIEHNNCKTIALHYSEVLAQKSIYARHTIQFKRHFYVGHAGSSFIHDNMGTAIIIIIWWPTWMKSYICVIIDLVLRHNLETENIDRWASTLHKIIKTGIMNTSWFKLC